MCKLKRDVHAVNVSHSLFQASYLVVIVLSLASFQVNPIEEKLARWTQCQLSGEPLQQPVVADQLGFLFNKDAVIQVRKLCSLAALLLTVVKHLVRPGSYHHFAIMAHALLHMAGHQLNSDLAVTFNES